MSDYTLPTRFDRLLHQPARLAIMAVLYGCEKADFKFLLQTTELTKGTLSKHLSNLEETGYVGITKSFKGKYPNTSVAMTPQGRKAFKTLRNQYQEFIKLTDT